MKKIKHFIKKIKKKGFLKNVLTVATGTALAQLITMVFSLFITRIYGPEQYGILGVFTSLAVVLMPVVALSYPIAIVLPQKNSEVKKIIKLSFYSIITISTFTLLLLLLFGDWFRNITNTEILGSFLLLIPLIMLFDGLLQIVQQTVIRKKYFKAKATVAVQQSIITNGSSTLLGLFKPIGIMLILVSVFGKAIYAFSLALRVTNLKKLKSVFKDFFNFTDMVEVNKVRKKYNDFPKFRAPQVLINGLSESLPIIILSSFYGPAASGFYVLGKKILEVPTQLIGNAVGDVFYPRIAEGANRKERIDKLLIKSNLVLALVGIVPFGTIILIGPELFSLVYGESWYTAGEYARWLSLWIYFMLLTRPTIKALPVIGAQKFHLSFTVVSIIIRATALIMGVFLMNDDVIAIALYSVAGSFLYLYLCIITIVKTKMFIKK